MKAQEKAPMIHKPRKCFLNKTELKFIFVNNMLKRIKTQVRTELFQSDHYYFIFILNFFILFLLFYCLFMMKMYLFL